MGYLHVNLDLPLNTLLLILIHACRAEQTRVRTYIPRGVTP